MSEDHLPPLREVIARHGLAAKKALGQNFLFDLNLTRRIAGDTLRCGACHGEPTAQHQKLISWARSAGTPAGGSSGDPLTIQTRRLALAWR